MLYFFSFFLFFFFIFTVILCAHAFRHLLRTNLTSCPVEPWDDPRQKAKGPKNKLSHIGQEAQIPAFVVPFPHLLLFCAKSSPPRSRACASLLMALFATAICPRALRARSVKCFCVCKKRRPTIRQGQRDLVTLDISRSVFSVALS